MLDIARRKVESSKNARQRIPCGGATETVFPRSLLHQSQFRKI